MNKSHIFSYDIILWQCEMLPWGNGVKSLQDFSVLFLQVKVILQLSKNIKIYIKKLKKNINNNNNNKTYIQGPWKNFKGDMWKLGSLGSKILQAFLFDALHIAKGNYKDRNHYISSSCRGFVAKEPFLWDSVLFTQRQVVILIQWIFLTPKLFESTDCLDWPHSSCKVDRQTSFLCQLTLFSK